MKLRPLVQDLVLAVLMTMQAGGREPAPQDAEPCGARVSRSAVAEGE